MAEIQFIVEKLNGAPFSKNLSLVTFDEKSPFELLSILNDILAALDARHAVDLRDEPQVHVGLNRERHKYGRDPLFSERDCHNIACLTVSTARGSVSTTVGPVQCVQT